MYFNFVVWFVKKNSYSCDFKGYSKMKAKHEKLMVLVVVFLVGLVSEVANAKLIAYWKLDEKTGSVATDSSGNDNAGILHGGVIWAPAEGKFKGAARFGQTDGDNIEIPLKNLSASKGTISLWCNLPPDPQPERHRYIFGHGTSPYWSNRIQLYLDEGNRRLDIGLGDTHTRFTGIKNFQPERWYHIALTWDNDNYVVYVDGLPEVSGIYAGFDQIGSVADIGNDGRNDGTQRNESFKGLIDDVAVFDHALNECEIMQLYNGTCDCFVSETFLTLLDNIRQVEQINKTSSPREVVSFLEEKIAEYHKWERKNPNEIGLHHKRLSCEQYFLLAKAKEVAKTPAGEIIEAYKQSVSQLQFRRNYVPALLWLYKNISARDFVDTVKKSVSNFNGVTGNLHRIAMDFELSGNWDAFELYLDAVFSEMSDSIAFAAVMAEGLSENGSWLDDFLKYARNNPKLEQYIIETYERHAREKIMQEEFVEAAGIYRDIANKYAFGHNKRIYELNAHECIFESGQYDRILSELDDFINENKSVDRDSAAKAMLMKGQVYIQLGKINLACETFSALMKEYLETQYKPEAGFFVGYCYILQGKDKQAIEAMKLVTENYQQNPFASKAHLCLARIDRKTE